MGALFSLQTPCNIIEHLSLYLLVPQLCGLGSCTPDVGEKLQHWHSLTDVIQLPQMTALHNLVNFVSHTFPYSWDLTSFLKPMGTCRYSSQCRADNHNCKCCI